MPRTFLGTQRALLVTKFALVAGMEVVKGGNVLSGWVARQPVKRRNRLPRSPNSLLCDPLEIVVKSHRNSPIPKAPTDQAARTCRMEAE